MAKHPRAITAGATLAAVVFMIGIQQSTCAASITREKLRNSVSEPTAIVQVDNVAAIPTDLLQVAENRAGDVFHKIGARVTWVDPATAAREHVVVLFTLVLVRGEQSRGRYRDAQDVFGFAVPTVHRGWVFWDRIKGAKARAPVIGILLGNVLAHELGHLMLSSPEHSYGGIMRPDVPMGLATETFTKSQARDILSRLPQIRAEDDSVK